MQIAEFFGSDAGQSWLQSLLGGLLGALVGALVAVFVLKRTLESQREENVRARLVDTTAALLTDIWHLADSIQYQPLFGREFTRVYADITTNLERIHLDISDNEADFYHAVSALLSKLHQHTERASRRGRIRLSNHDRDQWIGIIGLLGRVIAEWVRATELSTRKQHTDFLVDLIDVLKTQGLEGWRKIDEAAQVDETKELLKRQRVKHC